MDLRTDTICVCSFFAPCLNEDAEVPNLLVQKATITCRELDFLSGTVKSAIQLRLLRRCDIVDPARPKTTIGDFMSRKSKGLSALGVDIA